LNVPVTVRRVPGFRPSGDERRAAPEGAGGGHKSRSLRAYVHGEISLLRAAGIKCTVAWLAVAIWMGVIFWLSAIPSLHSSFEPLSDGLLRKGAHIGEYALLMWLLARALQLSSIHDNTALWAAVLLSLLYAVTDEWHQTFVPGREGTLRDVLIDGVGIIGMYTWERWRAPSPP
jgi:VanZ family protein